MLLVCGKLYWGRFFMSFMSSSLKKDIRNMMKYFLLFLSLLVVCFAKRLALKGHALNDIDKNNNAQAEGLVVNIIFKMELLAAASMKEVFKIRITNVPTKEHLRALQKVVQEDFLLETLKGLFKLEKTDKKEWTVSVLQAIPP
eukprot:Platyproteum_vivax@DN7357_c0_g2_i1.p1